MSIIGLHQKEPDPSRHPNHLVHEHRRTVADGTAWRRQLNHLTHEHRRTASDRAGRAGQGASGRGSSGQELIRAVPYGNRPPRMTEAGDSPIAPFSGSGRQAAQAVCAARGIRRTACRTAKHPQWRRGSGPRPGSRLQPSATSPCAESAAAGAADAASGRGPGSGRGRSGHPSR